MKKQLISLGLLALASQIFTPATIAQNDWLILQKGNRTKILKPEHMVAIGLVYDIAGDSLDCGHQRVAGRVMEAGEDSVRMQMMEEQITFRKANEIFKNNYSRFPEGKTYKQLPLDEVDYVEYQSKTARAIQVLGTILATAGSILMVASPSIAITTENGNTSFNNDRFADWAKAGLAGVGIGAELMWLSKKRTLSLKPSQQRKKVWTFKRQ